MSREYDRYLEKESYRDTYACCDCGYLRNSAHHPKIRCPKSGRCGTCGNDWPCQDHAPAVKIVEDRTVNKRPGKKANG